jgi:hypothetical protein
VATINEPNEEWKSLNFVIDCGDNYEVSNYGNVRNAITQQELKPRDKRGYFQVVLWKKGKRKDVCIHRLVALAFLGKNNKRNQVNHIDGNKKNNTLPNLEWVTPKENTDHAFQTGIRTKEKHAELMKKVHAKPVIQYNLSGNVVEIFDSAADASRATGARADTIHLQCKLNRMPKKHDFYFRYASNLSGGGQNRCS